MKSTSHREIIKYKNDQISTVSDVVTVEEPLEIRLSYNAAHGVFRTMSLAVTMRTPDHDEALVKGFLFTEGIIKSLSDIQRLETIEENIVLVTLGADVQFDAAVLQRNFYAGSSCGICGKASIESIHSDTIYLPWKSKMTINKSILLPLSDKLKVSQQLFSKTGGIHACALVTAEGDITSIYEDVGRHNAMDKLIGSQDQYPIDDKFVIVSGRASFELVQKASKAGIPILVAIGAPSSLAIQLAEEQGMTLIGFLKSTGFNIYCGAERINNKY